MHNHYGCVIFYLCTYGLLSIHLHRWFVKPVLIIIPLIFQDNLRCNSDRSMLCISTGYILMQCWIQQSPFLKDKNLYNTINEHLKMQYCMTKLVVKLWQSNGKYYYIVYKLPCNNMDHGNAHGLLVTNESWKTSIGKECVNIDVLTLMSKMLYLI